MIILALDTAAVQASVAVRRDGHTLVEEVFTSTDGHSHLIFPVIQTALDKAGATARQVDCFAAAHGPGSFTGVRVCLAAAMGLAEGTGKRALGVSNLRALATFGTARLRSPMIDARRGQFYAAIYDSKLALVGAETLVTAAEWVVDAERILITPPLAAAIAFCAELDGPERWRDPAELDANYVRRSDAEMYWVDTGAKAG